MGEDAIADVGYFLLPGGLRVGGVDREKVDADCVVALFLEGVQGGLDVELFVPNERSASS